MFLLKILETFQENDSPLASQRLAAICFRLAQPLATDVVGSTEQVAEAKRLASQVSSKLASTCISSVHLDCKKHSGLSGPNIELTSAKRLATELAGSGSGSRTTGEHNQLATIDQCVDVTLIDSEFERLYAIRLVFQVSSLQFDELVLLHSLI